MFQPFYADIYVNKVIKMIKTQNVKKNIFLLTTGRQIYYKIYRIIDFMCFLSNKYCIEDQKIKINYTLFEEG